MSRPLRNTNPDHIRLYTIRTFQQRFFMRPDEKINQIIGGVIARYQEKHSIEIFAYVVLSNHIHLLLRARKQNLWYFGRDVNREIAHRVNRKINREGSFWSRRYDEQICLRDEDALEALLYISCNPVSHGLVKHAHTWPGISSLKYGVLGEEKEFVFTHYSKFLKAKKRAKRGEKVKLSDFQTKHILKLSTLPIFYGETNMSYREKLKILILERERSLIADREKRGLSFLGRKAILRREFDERPVFTKKSSRPLCYTRCMKSKKKFISWYFMWWSDYKRASEKLRSGVLRVGFPEFCLKPPMHC